jgi:predicted O-methyltransferase YrrM
MIKQDNSENKLNFFIKKDLLKKKNLQILEFGVHKGISTKLFLNLLKKNKGKLISVDTVNYKDKFKDKNWTFLNTRDDDIKYIKKYLKKKFDLIYLDTEHNALHIQNILKLYFKYLKIDGIFLIDDIFWLPYVRGEYRDNFHIEINNRESFSSVLEIYNSNYKKLDLELTPKHTGMAKFTKKAEGKLNPFLKIKNREISFKNFIRYLRNILKNSFTS